MAPSDPNRAATPAPPTGTQKFSPAAAPETGIAKSSPNPTLSAPAQTPAVQAPAFAQLDALIAVVILVLAFVCASFPVKNSDFFLQLATGRLLVQGDYHFGDDPFTWVPDHPRWVNHSWLFSLLVHTLYQVPNIGEALLVGVKAVLVTLLVVVLMQLGRRPGRGLAVPAACAGLALVTLSQRLILQPSCVSFVFFGLTLWLLRWPRQRREARASAGVAPGSERNAYLSFWLLPLLFILWVNIDSWFVLGPLAVALYLVGEWLGTRLAPQEGPETPGPGELQTLALVLGIGLVACLANPFGYHAFTLPEQLQATPGARAAEQDLAFTLSPLDGVYFQRRLGLSAAGLAYFVLLALLVVSFVLAVLGRGGWRVLLSWRLLLTLPLAILSLYLARGIPFFAVVAGPVLALNFLDGPLGQTAPVTRGSRSLALAGRLLILVAFAAAVAAAVPGWLQGNPHTFHVGWRVDPDPSLRQAAERIGAWQKQGLVSSDTHWFNLTPEVANYLAWYAPGERTFLNQRFALSDDMAHDLAVVRRALSGRDDAVESSRPEGRREPSWRSVFREQGVRFLLLQTEAQRAQSQRMMYRLLANPDEWVPCFLNGRTAIFGWKDPKAPAGPDPFAALRLDFLKLAFGPDAEKAPEEAPNQPTSAPPWWSEFWTPAPPLASDCDLAAFYTLRFEARKPSFRDRNARDLTRAVTVWTVGASAAPGGPVLNNSLLPAEMAFAYRDRFGERVPEAYQPPIDALARGLLNNYQSSQDLGPPDALYLALRAARRAVAVNPEDPQPYLVLGTVYYTLWRQTRDHVLGSALPQLGEIRRAQIIGALTTALKYHPPLSQAQQVHNTLAEVYASSPQPYLDLIVKHRREWLRLAEAAGPPAGADPKAFTEAVQQLSKEIEKDERDVKGRQDKYEINTVGKPAPQKVVVALQQGLAETALNVVLHDPDWQKAFADNTTKAVAGSIMLDLFLTTGRLDEIQEFLDPNNTHVLDEQFVALHRVELTRHAAVVGDYAQADRYLADLLPPGKGPGAKASETAAQLLAPFLLREALRATRAPVDAHSLLPVVMTPQGQVIPDPLASWPSVTVQTSYVVLEQLNRESEIYLLRGWLALEAGQTAEAEKYLRLAQTLTVPPQRWAPLLFRMRNGMAPQLASSFRALALTQGPTQELVARCRAWLAEARK